MGGYQDQLIPWDELCPGLLAPVPPVTSVPQPCGHLLWPCHGDQGQTKLIPCLETVPVSREWNWCQAGCPAGSSFPGGKEKADVHPPPQSLWGQQWHLDTPLLRPGDTVAWPQWCLRDWEMSQVSQIPAVPWLCPAGSATGNPKSSKCIPSASLSSSFPSGIYRYCSLNHITPSHSTGHGHSLSHALGMGMGSCQLPGAQGSWKKGMRSHPGAGCEGSHRESSVSPEPQLG